ncbi:hypothetical protein POV27_14880 [Aureisphaera galaxeae]|uniref:hypothetical protein n=1 Tax=Aureisphaera galaxeae TaxID=1538023 RepID=UPI002350A1EA|nr:hypothetical protein [Aureisphaera galaxeae]MDC8005345.1 hypothetical protein [Aureisphaera galaxeae]
MRSILLILFVVLVSCKSQEKLINKANQNKIYLEITNIDVVEKSIEILINNEENRDLWINCDALVWKIGIKPVKPNTFRKIKTLDPPYQVLNLPRFLLVKSNSQKRVSLVTNYFERLEFDANSSFELSLTYNNQKKNGDTSVDTVMGLIELKAFIFTTN